MPWYNSILTSSVCPNENLGGYNIKPQGFETATDWLNFAIVIGSGVEGAYLRAFSNGEQVAQTIGVTSGFNYGYFDDISAGFQRVELVAADGSVLIVAAGGRCISSGCPDCIYNLNPVVVGFGTDTGIEGKCYQRDCSPVPSSNGSLVYIDPIIFIEPSPHIGDTPPCTFIIPPSSMPTLSTISFAPISTSFVLGGSTITSVSPLPITTSIISFFSIFVESSIDSSSFALITSLKPDPLTFDAGGASTIITFPPVNEPYFGPEMVIISEITYTVFGGEVTIGSTSLNIPPAKSTAQIFTINGVLVSIAASTTSSIDVYSLPTTVVTSNGVTQTFSLDQFTQYATITTQTTITTTIAATETGESSTTSSTTLIPLWLQAGGFYWSPVPIPFPTINPFPIPFLPEFPSLPDPPCFKLLGIFSIDCPPDKTRPTTTFISGPPFPTCTRNCGTLCQYDCEMSETSSSEEPTSTSISTSTSTTCDVPLSTATGFCSNVNYPLWDIGSETVLRNITQDIFDDLSDGYLISDCQAAADVDATGIEEIIAQAIDCCSANDPEIKRSQILSGFDIFGRQAPLTCSSSIGYYRSKAVAPGSCHSTYTCDGDPVTGFPNVCANASSAILSRGRTSILTYSHPNKLHDTSLYVKGKYEFEGKSGSKFARDLKNNEASASDGWGLNGCEIEEYPFGSGSPTRSTSSYDVMNSRAVNRLIYHTENRAHGNDIQAFYLQAGYYARSQLGEENTKGQSLYALADGIIYCMEFKNTPTTNDDAGFLLDSTSYNICAQPYGVQFTLVTQAYGLSVYPPPGSTLQWWDPWFDVPNTNRKTLQIVSQSPEVREEIPPQYCQYPSPGTKTLVNGIWSLVDENGVIYGFPQPRMDPGINSANLRCTDVPTSTPMKRDIKAISDKFSEAILSKTTKTQIAKIPRIRGRQATPGSLGPDASGSFLDASVFQFLSCPNDDYDPCANGDNGCDDDTPDSTTYTSPTSMLLPTGSASNAASPTPICIPEEDPDADIPVWCACDGSDATFPILPPTTSPYNPCGYTTLPTLTSTAPSTITPAPTPVCVPEQDPDAGLSGWCACDGVDSTLPLLPSTTSPYNPCGYTSLPTPYIYTDIYGDVISCASSSILDIDTLTITACVPPSSTMYAAPTSQNPYPYTYTDIYGDVIACATSSILDVGTSPVTICAGSSSTVYTVPTAAPKAGPYPYGFSIWDVTQQTLNCIVSRRSDDSGGDNRTFSNNVVRPSPADCITTNTYLGLRAASNDNFCNQDEWPMYNATDPVDTNTNHMEFPSGICGSAAPYYCNVDSTNSSLWNCADTYGNSPAQCVTNPENALQDFTVCPGPIISETNYVWVPSYLCTGTMDCDSSS